MYSLRGQDYARGGSQISNHGVRPRFAGSLVCAVGVLHEDRPAPGRAPGLHVSVGVADHPGSLEVDAQLFGCGDQHPRRGLATVATP